MTETVRAQLYLSLRADEAGGLEALLQETKPACVRLIAGEDDAGAARDCRALCHARDVPLLIAGQDDAAVALARAVGADGVHLTGSPKAAPWVRRELGEDCIVGIDPGLSRHDAMIAAETGADYVSLSPDWETDDAVPEAVLWWGATVETPMVVETARTAIRARAVRVVAEFVACGVEDAVTVAGVLGEAG